MAARRGEGAPRESDFFTKNPNLKKFFFGGGGEGARVSEFFLQRIQF